MILPITLYKNPILRLNATELANGFDLNKIVEQMFQTVENASGCGLAAPQVGNSDQLFIIDYAEEDGLIYKKAFINPKIEVHNGEMIPFKEGCLSLPGVGVTVNRIEDVTITYYGIDWKKRTERYKGFMARIIQHEYDHLIGRMIIDYTKDEEKADVEQALENLTQKKIEIEYPVVENKFI